LNIINNLFITTKYYMLTPLLACESLFGTVCSLQV